LGVSGAIDLILINLQQEGSIRTMKKENRAIIRLSNDMFEERVRYEII
jgi:hypothetical protein